MELKAQQTQKLNLTLTTIGGATASETFSPHTKIQAVIARARELLKLPPNPPREYVAYLEIAEGQQRELNPKLSLQDEGITTGATLLIVSPQNKDG
jgi:hypothetical protein